MHVAFSNRPASIQWEPLPIPRIPGLSLWAWFRPQQMPSGVLVSVPEEVIARASHGFPFTLADVFYATGIEPAFCHSVSLFGAAWQPAMVLPQLLLHPIPPIPAGGKAEISILVMETVAAPIPVQSVSGIPDSDIAALDDYQADDVDPADTGMMYERIDSAWRSAIQMERQMTGLRQKLSAVLNTLGKLDRDLNPDERLAADREDRDAWHDARRWLRDLSAKCHREIKCFDVGMTSAAGKRNWMEDMYKQVIEPRSPSNDLENIRREFEVYRKDMVNLQKSMHAALQGATQNGTQRAQRVLGVISRKIRERRAKMREPLGGTNMDRSVRRKS